MSELICIAFKGRDTAQQVLTDLQGMQKEYLVELADSCIVTRDPDGKLQLHQAVNLVTTGAVSGGTLTLFAADGSTAVALVRAP